MQECKSITMTTLCAGSDSPYPIPYQTFELPCGSVISDCAEAEAAYTAEWSLPSCLKRVIVGRPGTVLV